MDSVMTKYPVEIVTDEKVEETDCMLEAGTANLGRVESPASTLLTHIDTIRRLRELGVSGDFIITCGDFRITLPEK